jgi:outer membrane protein OmpA-like peptidoglycan-associated protein
METELKYVAGEFEGYFYTLQKTALAANEPFPIDSLHNVYLYRGELREVKIIEEYKVQEHLNRESLLLHNVTNIQLHPNDSLPFKDKRIYNFEEVLIKNPEVVYSWEHYDKTYGIVKGSILGKIGKITAPGGGTIPPPQPPLPTDPDSQKGGCESLLPKGCSNSISPGGCLPSLLGQNKGCFDLLKLLALLGLLIAALSYLFNSCNKNDGNTIPLPIHDTVIKRDTIRIKTEGDTLKYVDSTTVKDVEMVPLPNVQFKTNSNILLPGSEKDLKKLAENLIKNKNVNATIIGHTDNVGKPEANMNLSQRRAESVRQALIRYGVEANRLEAIGKGDTEARADNSTLEGRMLNRRVEVILTKLKESNTKRTRLE